MSKEKEYLDGFLDDVSTINPEFRPLTSSLRGLVRYLEQTIHNPQRFQDVNSAFQHCWDPNHNDLRKYRPAVERLIEVWGKGSFTPYPGSSLKHIEIGRMCFRGDGRKPEIIFGDGFKKRDLGSKVKYRNFKFDHSSLTSSISSAGDVKPETAVCISPDMNAAALFPLPVDQSVVFATTWIYLVYVKSGYHTHGRMVLDALTGLRSIQHREYRFRKQASVGINGLLYGQEMATDAIPATSVWGALEIWRVWNERDLKTDQNGKFDKKTGSLPRYLGGANFTAGGVYTIRKWIPNENAHFSTGYRQAVRHFVDSMQNDIGTGTQFPLPRPNSGYKPSFGFDGVNQIDL
jgi:hypothetical protein